MTLLTVILAIGLSAAVGMALSIEQRYREEADIRTTQALQMDFAERYFSLASGMSGQTATFRPETGGVSLESNHWIRVREVSLSVTNDALMFTIDSGDDRRASPATNRFRSDALMRAKLTRPDAVVSVTASISGTNTPVRRLVLESVFREEIGRGARKQVTYRTNRVSRPIRLWNYD